MPSNLPNQNTTTNIGVSISELKESFYITSKVINLHKELHPGRWNRCEEDTGSAFLNLGVVIYFLRKQNPNTNQFTSKEMHGLSRLVYNSLQTFLTEELGLLNPEIIFEREDTFDWEYTTRGFQLLRDYDLLSYPNSIINVRPLIKFCNDNGISTFQESTTEVELKILKTLNIDGASIEVPQSVNTEVLAASLELLEEIAISQSIRIDRMGFKNEVKVLRRGQECDASSLNAEELSSISNQLKKSPNLLRKLLSVRSDSGSV